MVIQYIIKKIIYNFKMKHFISHNLATQFQIKHKHDLEL